MINHKRLCVLLVVLMLCSMVLFTACGDKDDSNTDPSTSSTTAPGESTEPSVTEPSVTEPSVTEPSATEPSSDADYKIILTDGVGAPYTQKVKVRFVQDGAQKAMAIVNTDGVAEKNLPRGNYDILIESYSSDVTFYYDANAAKVTADVTEIQIVVAQDSVDAEGNPLVPFETIFAGDSDRVAYSMSVGSTHVKLAEGQRSYFLFTPTQAGTYEVSVAGDVADIGLYGASTHFISDYSIRDIVDNKLCLTVQPGMIGSGETGTTVYVLGLDAAEGITDGVLNIIRTGDAPWSFDEEPWTNYVPKQEINPFVMDPIAPGNALKSFDLTAASDAYVLVLNEEDGTYHLGTADGPRVYVQLGQSVEGISLMGMVGEIVIQNGVPMQTGTAPFRYSYNNGEDDFFKEDYTDAMRQYVTNRDKASGLYPLNEDLYYMLPLGVYQNGWCRKGTSNYLFGEKEINPDIGWMFLLVYEDGGVPGPVDPTDPSDPSDPTDPSGDTDVTVPTECTHEYAVSSEQQATCTEKGSVVYTCALCGDSYSQTLAALGHDYSKVTCTEPRTCKLCGLTSGEPMGHNFNDATCVRPKTCKICSATEGEALGHDFGDAGKCSRCGTADPDCEHVYEDLSGKDATCTEPGWFESVCTKCGQVISGDIPEIPHSYLDATCIAPKTCEMCGATEGEPLGHSYSEDGNCALCGQADPYFIIGDNRDAPVIVDTVYDDASHTASGNVSVSSRHLLYVQLFKLSGTTLTINNEFAYVIYDGVRYDAVDGVVTVPDLYSSDTRTPILLAIGNIGEDASFALMMTYPSGTHMNPYTFDLGTMTVSSEAGNEQGVYFLWKPTIPATDKDAHVFTVTLINKTDGVGCKIDLTNMFTYRNESLDTTLTDSMSVNIEVKAGQQILIVIGALPDADGIYPAADIQITATIS